MAKIIVAHPFRQHSFRLATALNEENCLLSYCTTVYDKKGSLMGFVKKFLKGANLKKAAGRKCDAIEDNQVKLFCECRGYFALLLNRICPFPNLNRTYQRYLYRSFGKKVARFAMKQDADAVIMFDTTATACFKLLKESHSDISCILDMAAITRPYARKIYDEEEERLNINIYSQQQKYLSNQRVMEYMNQELKFADIFLVASKFVEDSLYFCGVNDKKIYTIPYGVDLNRFRPIRTNNETSKLKILYVGHVAYQKGVHYLLSAVKSLPQDTYVLDLYGMYSENDPLYGQIKKNSNVQLHGFVTPDKLPEIYCNADVFVFPSTNDGYGLVVLESLACGTPVISSRNAGACDLISEGVNGFCFDSGDVDKLASDLEWCLKHKNQLKIMREAAVESVKNHTWESYYKSILNVVSENF